MEKILSAPRGSLTAQRSPEVGESLEWEMVLTGDLTQSCGFSTIKTLGTLFGLEEGFTCPQFPMEETIKF